MKKQLVAAFGAAFVFAVSVCAQTTTPNLGLFQPTQGQYNWAIQVNRNWSIIDQAVGALQEPYQGAWSATQTYAKGQFVLYSGQEWISTVNGNLGNTPATGSVQWEETLGLSGAATLSGNNTFTGANSYSALQTFFAGVHVGSASQYSVDSSGNVSTSGSLTAGSIIHPDGSVESSAGWTLGSDMTWHGAPVAVPYGGTGAVTAAAALSNLLGNPAAGSYGISCSSATSCSPGAGGGGGTTIADLGTLTYNAGGTTTFAAASAGIAAAKVTVTHSTATTFVPTGLVKWGSYQVEIIQDSTGGGVTFTLGSTGTCSVWKITGGGAGAITLSSSANAIDMLTFTYDGTNCIGSLLANAN